jgi:eukaryotic-like serine/threonine-protein kinase
MGIAFFSLALIIALVWSLRQGVWDNREQPLTAKEQDQAAAQVAGINTIEAGFALSNEVNDEGSEVIAAIATSTNALTQTPPSIPTAVPSTNIPAPTSTPLPSPTLPPSPTPVVVNSIDDAELVYIPSGEFTMGSDPKDDPYFFGSEGPQHMVYLDGYWIYRTEVTNAMYEKCVEANECPKPINNGSNTRRSYYGNQDYADHPVVYITWRNASSYCQWAGGRLPTEAEWEKSARGSDGRLFPWGNQAPQPDHANYGARDTEAVGSYPEGASPYGVLDMAGNVIEWVRDYFQAAYYQVSVYENPLGPISGSTRVYRGGAYHNPAASIRTVMRGSRSESHANVDIGFRCVLDVPAE